MKTVPHFCGWGGATIIYQGTSTCVDWYLYFHYKYKILFAVVLKMKM